eukprot:4682418-Pyramimonas_sp.AAC.1
MALALEHVVGGYCDGPHLTVGARAGLRELTGSASKGRQRTQGVLCRPIQQRLLTSTIKDTVETRVRGRFFRCFANG